jgi:hypothetical protein
VLIVSAMVVLDIRPPDRSSRPCLIADRNACEAIAKHFLPWRTANSVYGAIRDHIDQVAAAYRQVKEVVDQHGLEALRAT